MLRGKFGIFTLMESFAQLFEESLKNVETRPGSMVKGKVVDINNGLVIVDTGLKSESAIPQEQFMSPAGELEVKVGDVVDVALESVESGDGETQSLARRQNAMKLGSSLKTLSTSRKLLPALSMARSRAASLFS